MQVTKARWRHARLRYPWRRLDSYDVAQNFRHRPTHIAFGPFRYDTVHRELRDADGPVRIGSRALQLLEILLESPGRLYSREELVARVWPRTVVEETSLRVHMSALRRLLGDGQDGSKYIVTVPGRGYTFVGEVQLLTVPAESGTASRAGDTRPSQRGPATHLGRPIGRGKDIARIGELLVRERFVSIVGAGGMGKTTVALAVAENEVARHEQSTFFVDLSSVSEEALVIVEVGQSCGINVSRDDPWPALQAALQDQQVLIVLDNCEHMIDAVAAVADRILRACPQVRILATSREALEIEGEWVFRLPPLDLPEPGMPLETEGALAYPAIQLFVERAVAASDSFQLADANLAAVRQLCEFLDGIPLAIELAAARVSSLGVQGLLFRLEKALELLTRGRRTAMSRHRTLHAVLDWSYQLLTDTERLVLQRLATFRSAFDLEAAVAVASCAELPKDRVVDDLMSLHDKSLVMLEANDRGQARYRLLYITRLFAEKALTSGPDAAAVRHRHAELVLVRVVASNTAKADAGVKSLNYLRSLNFGSAVAELHTAINWALLDENDLALGIEITAEALHAYDATSLVEEYRRYLNTAVDKAGRAGVEGGRLEFKLQQRLSFVSGQAFASLEARENAYRRVRELGPKFGSTADQIEALYGMCTSAYGHGDYLQALSCCEEIRDLAQGGHEVLSVAVADRLSVLSLHALGQHDAAERLAYRVIQLDTSVLELRFQGDVPFGVSMRIQLARIHWLRGDFQRAWATVLDTIARDDAAHIFEKCHPLGLAAIPIAIWKGDTASAAKWCQQLRDHSTRTSVPYWQAFAKVYACLLEGRPLEPESTEARLLQKSPMLRDIAATLQASSLDSVTLARVRAGQVGWCAPELLRLAALADFDPQQHASRARCIEALASAWDLSEEQGARFWSLRVAKSLFEISLEGSTERASAKGRILSLLNVIDDGSPMPDLQQARLMVEAQDLTHSRPPVPAGLRQADSR
jgi:predicted ATPase/DNA-binding winged helix-turn-helix (wHTH) protein